MLVSLERATVEFWASAWSSLLKVALHVVQTNRTVQLPPSEDGITCSTEPPRCLQPMQVQS